MCLMLLGCRYCLASLKHGNSRNASDILQAIRLNPELGRDFRRLKDALEVLGEASAVAVAVEEEETRYAVEEAVEHAVERAVEKAIVEERIR